MGVLTIDHRCEQALASDLPAQAAQNVRRQMLLVDLIFITTAVTFIFLAPGGQWMNQVMGVPMWWNGDPGAGYIVGSLYAFTAQRREFVGHPGLPLQLMVGAAAKLIHAIY